MHPKTQSVRTHEICSVAPVIPVLVVQDSAQGKPLAEALIAGGLSVLEVTLRSEAALDVIREMSKVPGGHVGAGTVLTPRDVYRAKDAGAAFAVSPGATDTLVQACEDASLPLLPGAVTASEIMRCLDYGFDMMKFFPAEAYGGAAALKALSGPMPNVRFCPTGGVTAENAETYLSLPNVICVGSSWLAPPADLEAGAYDIIRQRAQAAAQLRRG